MRFRSFDSLSIFRVVAERMSFTSAADRLSLSKGAVSYQIAKLEQELGFELFERHHTHIRLTARGEALLKETSRHLGKLEDIIADLRDVSQNRLCLGAHSWFISRWLGARLSGFTAAHPEISLRIEPINTLHDLDNPDLDLTVFWCEPSVLDRDAEILYTSRTGPMSNAEIASQASELGIDRVMRTVPLLPDASGMEGWRQWHRSAGLTFAPGQMSVQLPDANTRLQAVISGHGIALLDELAQPELDTGQMVRISDIAIENFAYYLVPGLRKPLSPAADSFRSWLKDQDFP